MISRKRRQAKLEKPTFWNQIFETLFEIGFEKQFSKQLPETK